MHDYGCWGIGERGHEVECQQQRWEDEKPQCEAVEWGALSPHSSAFLVVVVVVGLFVVVAVVRLYRGESMASGGGRRKGGLQALSLLNRRPALGLVAIVLMMTT